MRFCIKTLFYYSLIILSTVIFSVAYASVVMTGTRIIYNGNDKSADINLKNKSNFPYVVQTWFDDGNLDITPNSKTNIPFISMPAIFKMEPNAIQVIRIIYTKKKQLPQDRESVFYFNFLEIPPLNVNDSSSSSSNKMLITLRNRVKLFYRPANLAGSSNDLLDKLIIKRLDNSQKLKIEITNPSPFYVSIGQIEFITQTKNITTAADMIAPFSSNTFVFNNVLSSDRGDIKLTIINDQGSRLSENYPINK